MFLADAKSIRFRESPKEGWDLEKYYGTDQKKVADDILVEHTSYTANNMVGMMACLLALESCAQDGLDLTLLVKSFFMEHLKLLKKMASLSYLMDNMQNITRKGCSK
ncbi:unnamed protein product [Trifolium pratense]|uniref:Uncharacterized protein n=1 Tax=Trifolium pratense TaxID=57577 RepID=A0ACB0JLB5_TRIPR|nr:unnamed protein product [Trifolium pratense]